MEYSVCHERATMTDGKKLLLSCLTMIGKGLIGKKCAQDTMIQRMPNEGLLSEMLTLSIRFHS